MRPADNDILQGYSMSRKSTSRVSVSWQRLQTLNDSCILSLKNFLLALASLRVTEQSISSSISLVLAIIDAKIVAEQLFGLGNLAGAQALCIYKLT